MPGLVFTRLEVENRQQREVKQAFNQEFLNNPVKIFKQIQFRMTRVSLHAVDPHLSG